MGTGPAPMRTPSHTTSTKADSLRRIEVITGVGRRRRWTDEEKAWIVAESLDPATTVSAVARRDGRHGSQLFVWGQQLAAPAGGGGEGEGVVWGKGEELGGRRIINKKDTSAYKG